MTDKAEPRFVVGDRVVSFRGERATVTWVGRAEAPHRSHRVCVHFDGKLEADRRDFYETVFMAEKEFDSNGR
jgi:hypothetical protein